MIVVTHLVLVEDSGVRVLLPLHLLDGALLLGEQVAHALVLAFAPHVHLYVLKNVA